MAKCRYTVEQAAAFAAKYMELGSAVKAADFFGVDPYYVRGAVKRIGGSPRDYAVNAAIRKRALTEEQDVEVVKLFRSGMTYAGLADTFGVSKHAVRECIERNGARERRRGPTVKLTGADRGRISAAFDGRSSVKAVADELGLNRQAVRKALKEAGVTHIPRLPKFGSRLNRLGYVEILLKEEDWLYPSAKAQGYMLEHRYVVANALGRPLLATETVHHINGDKTDNRVENLQLHHKAHAKGVSLRCRCCGSTDIEALDLCRQSIPVRSASPP